MFKPNLICAAILLLAATPAAANAQIWQEVSGGGAPLSSTGASARSSADSSMRRYKVDNTELRASLQRVTEVVGPGSQRVIQLPMPDGSLADFEIYESPVMEDELAQKYPEIRTFQVYGIDDPLASGRLDITPAGFHAMVFTSQGRLFIDPERTPVPSDLYLARTRNSATTSGYSCRLDEMDLPKAVSTDSGARALGRSSNKFRQYRLAVAATDDYVDEIFNPVAAGGKRAQAQAEIVTAINRVNSIYQRDLAVFFKLVNDNDDLIETNGQAGFNNSDTGALFNQNQAWIDSELGNNRYDVGHVFSTGNGGLAFLGSACDNNNKARGVSGLPDPTGDPFYIDFVAHEIGHQFNAEHTFNGSTLSCGPNRSPDAAFEPGSGSTIMAYAGICGVEDLQSNSDATFHAGSIMQMDRFISNAGSCFNRIDATPVNSNNPVVVGLSNKSIPANTPFVLDSTATDADLDVLSYQWDQMDTGCPTTAASFGDDRGSNPLFRSYAPQAVSERHFPAMGTQVQGLFDDAETLPCQPRKMNFRLTVRDDLAGQDTTDIRVSVEPSGKGFEVTNLKTPGVTVVSLTDTVDVEWRVGKTDQAPVNCANVDIELMTFAPAYASYSIHPLAMGTANDGAESITIMPVTLDHPRARIRVKCSDNIFYDISDVDFIIDGTGAASFGETDTVTFFNNNGTTGTTPPQCRTNVSCDGNGNGDLLDGASGSKDASALDYRWLMGFGALLLLVQLRRRSFTRRSGRAV